MIKIYFTIFLLFSTTAYSNEKLPSLFGLTIGEKVSNSNIHSITEINGWSFNYLFDPKIKDPFIERYQFSTTSRTKIIENIYITKKDVDIDTCFFHKNEYVKQIKNLYDDPDELIYENSRNDKILTVNGITIMKYNNFQFHIACDHGNFMMSLRLRGDLLTKIIKDNEKYLQKNNSKKEYLN